MTARAYMRGHPVEWVDGKWRHADDGSLTPADGGDERPCVKCGQTAEPDGPDPCLGRLPGVTSACCGHGVEPQQITYHSITCQDPCPGWGCQCCHDCPDTPRTQPHALAPTETPCCATQDEAREQARRPKDQVDS